MFTQSSQINIIPFISFETWNKCNVLDYLGGGGGAGVNTLTILQLEYVSYMFDQCGITFYFTVSQLLKVKCLLSKPFYNKTIKVGTAEKLAPHALVTTYIMLKNFV